MSVLGFRLSGARVVLLAPDAGSSGGAAPALRWGPAANEAVADRSLPTQGMPAAPARIH
jgi:hypothetical protein